MGFIMQYVNNPYMINNPYANNMGYTQQGYNYPQYNNYQMNQQQIQQSQSLNGQIIADFNEVSSKNTPLDGSSVYFPLVDGSAIYCKKLNVNTGASQLFTYKLVEQNTDQKDSDVTSTLSQLKSEIQELKNIILSKNSPQLPKLDLGKGGDQ